MLEEGHRKAEKIGGILCEGFGSSTGTVFVVGAGVNLAAAPDPELLRPQDRAASVSSWLGLPLAPSATELDAIAAGFADRISEVALELSDLSVRARLAEAYSGRALFKPGDVLEWESFSSGGAPTTRESGRVIGLGEDAELRVHTSAGDRALTSEEVRKVRARA
jgi:biotin-(acetyl-CoA carboxylase) ligase